MMLPLRPLLIAAIFFFSLRLTVAAIGNDPNASVVLSNVSMPYSDSTSYGPSPGDKPKPGTVIHSTIQDEHGYTHDMISTVVESDIVQIANDNVPDEPRMAKKEWQGEATIEVYMLSDVINTVGNVTGSLIYGAVWQSLNIMCPEKIGNNDNPPCWRTDRQIGIRYKDGKEGKFSETYSQIMVISSKFGTAAARKPLFGALAAAYEAMTHNDRNCFTVKDDAYNNRYCNVAMQASAFTEDSHIYMSLTSDIRDDKFDGSWNCCETREFVDTKLDAGAVKDFKGIYSTKRNKQRLVECHMGCADNQRVSLIDIDKMLIDVIDHQFW